MSDFGYNEHGPVEDGDDNVITEEDIYAETDKRFEEKYGVDYNDALLNTPE
jgi:hypothetical protein